MLRHAGGMLCCGAVLAGCSFIMGAPDQRPPDPAPQALPPVKQIIANSTDLIFDASTNPKNIAIGGIRRFDSAVGSEFGVCLRATVTNKSGKQSGPAVYVITVARNRMSDRRRAVPADACDDEKYEPL